MKCLCKHGQFYRAHGAIYMSVFYLATFLPFVHSGQQSSIVNRLPYDTLPLYRYEKSLRKELTGLSGHCLPFERAGGASHLAASLRVNHLRVELVRQCSHSALLEERFFGWWKKSPREKAFCYSSRNVPCAEESGSCSFLLLLAESGAAQTKQMPCDSLKKAERAPLERERSTDERRRRRRR